MELGIWNVEAWSREITTTQLKWWLAYYRVEPFGQTWRRTARQTAIIAAMVSGKYSEELEEKLLPTYRGERPQSEEEMLAELRKSPLFREALGG